MLIYQADTLEEKILMEPLSVSLCDYRGCIVARFESIVQKWRTRFDHRCVSSTQQLEIGREVLKQSTVDCVKSNVKQEIRTLLKVCSST